MSKTKITKPVKKDLLKKKIIKKAEPEKKQPKQSKQTPVKISKISGKKIFELEIGMLDSAQNDLFELIANRPDARNIEAVRLYVDNVFQVMNRVVTLVMDAKNNLIKKEIPQAITEIYNSPAK